MHKNHLSYQHNVIRPGTTTRLMQYQHPLDKIYNPASAEDTSNKCTCMVYSLRRDCVTETNTHMVLAYQFLFLFSKDTMAIQSV